jgi:hypothetical protein
MPAGNSGFAKVAGKRTLSNASQPPSQSRQTLQASPQTPASAKHSHLKKQKNETKHKI